MDENGDSMQKSAWKHTPRELLSLYFMLIGARIRCQMQYKVSFIMDALGTFASSGVDLVVIFVLFGHVESLAGWRLPEVGLLYGLSTLSFALCELFLGGFDYFAPTIRAGQFDNLLMKPLPDFMQVLAAEFVLRRLAGPSWGLAWWCLP